MTSAIRRLRARRALSRAANHGIWLCCLQRGRRLYVFTEDLVVVWPPRHGQLREQVRPDFPAGWAFAPLGGSARKAYRQLRKLVAAPGEDGSAP
jgi:hypothetical protein